MTCVQGFRPQAMAVTCDPEHKFELALQLGDLKIAYQLAKDAEVCQPCIKRFLHLNEMQL